MTFTRIVMYTFSEGWAVNLHGQVFHTSSGIARWQDAGKNWDSSDLTGTQNAEPLGILQLYSQDGQHTWLLGQVYPGMFHVYATLYSSQDGGAHWTKIQDPLANPDNASILKGVYSLPYGLEIMTFLNEQEGFAGTSELQQTADGDKSWQSVTLP